jgi:hypothetical protein
VSVRLGAAPEHEMDPAFWPFHVLVATAGAGFFLFRMLRSADAANLRAALVFLASTLATLALALWALWTMVLIEQTSHAVRLSPRGVRVGTVAPGLLRGRSAARRSFARAGIESFAVEQEPASTRGVRLFAYRADGVRFTVVPRRPRAELAWVAHVLNERLAALPPAPLQTDPGAAGAPRVLPYEQAAEPGRTVDIRRPADGGVIVSFFPTAGDQVGWFVALLGFLALLVGGVPPVSHHLAKAGAPAQMLALLAIAFVAAADLATLAWYFRRRRLPEVVGVDATHLYPHPPRSQQPLTRWPRTAIRDVREGDVPPESKKKAVEIVIAVDYEVRPLTVGANCDAWQRRRVIEALRAALATDAPPAIDEACNTGGWATRG